MGVKCHQKKTFSSSALLLVRLDVAQGGHEHIRVRGAYLRETLVFLLCPDILFVTMGPFLCSLQGFAGQDEHNSATLALQLQQLGVQPWQRPQTALLHRAPLVHRHTEAMVTQLRVEATYRVRYTSIRIWGAQQHHMTLSADLREGR